MRKYSFVITILLVFLWVIPVFAEKPPAGEGWQFFDKQKSNQKGANLSLIPDFDQSDSVLADLYENDPALCIELLYRMPLPETDGDVLEYIYSKLLSISSMAGIEYYSANKDRMTLYLAKCFLVDRGKSKKALPDPVFEGVKDFWQGIIYQKDTTFGDNWYDLRITATDTSIRMRLQNIEPMKIFIFPILEPYGVVIELNIIVQEKEILFYAMSQLERSEGDIFGKKVHLPGVFDHRISSYQSWLAKRIYPSPRAGKIE